MHHGVNYGKMLLNTKTPIHTKEGRKSKAGSKILSRG